MITNTSLNQHRFHLSLTSNDSNAEKTLKSKNDNALEKDNLSKSNSNISLKKNDPLQQLMEQKQNILDSKQKYLDNALAKNESANSIKDRVKEYEKQLSDIDKQINELKLEEQKKTMSNDDHEKDKKTDKSDDNSNGNKTQGNSKLENGDHMMDHLVSISNNLSEAKSLSREKTLASGEKNVLKNEIKIDEGRGLNPFKKRERVAKLEDNINNIEKKIGENLEDSTSSNKSVITNKNEKVNSKNPDESDSNKENSPKSIEDLNILQTIKFYKDNEKDNTEINDAKINSRI
jgi:hypothetical protein